jgi:thiol-disulfide isomerase/thioredoxin
MFICRHCPYVQHVKEELARLGAAYAKKDVGIVAISANDVANFPDDSPGHLQAMAKELHFTFHLCYDASQEIAKSYTAACTPDFFLFDKRRRLVYRGQLDESRPGNNKPVTGRDLRAALEAVLAGKPVNQDQQPSIGCNIKWKPGNEPDYFKYTEAQCGTQGPRCERPVMFEKLRGKIDQMKLIRRLMQDEQLKALISHPKVQALLQDPAFRELISSKDPAKIATHPNCVALMQDPEVGPLLAKLDPQRFIQS